MDLRHLRYFVAVAEEGHFSRAADRLRIVQPALSMQIKALEVEVGGLLFKRTNRKVELTEAGEIFLVEARRTLYQAGHALETVQRSIRGESGVVRVGLTGSAALAGNLMQDLAKFQSEFPKAELQLHEVPPHKQPDALLAGHLDVCYWPNLFDELDSGLNAIPVGSWPLVVALAVDHPLATQKNISVDDISENPLILYSAQSQDDESMWAVDQLIQRKPPVIHRVSSALTVLALAAAKLGLAPVPAPLQQVAFPNVVFRELKGVDITFQLMLLHRADETSGAVRAFLELTRRNSA